MVDFDRLNRETREFNHSNVNRFNNNGLSASEKLAMLNNETFRARNGCYPDRPYGPYGTYSTGK